VTSYSQYAGVIRAEMLRNIHHLTYNAKESLEYFIKQSEAGLRVAVSGTPHEVLADDAQLARVLRNLRASYGDYVDLGLINSDGVQISYVGPYKLKGRNYADQQWFHQVSIHGAYFSDVFLGYRNVPHFSVAVKHETEANEFYILRATIDAEALKRRVGAIHIRPSSDAFIINHEGILQTPSRLEGNIFEPSPIPRPPTSRFPQVKEDVDKDGVPYVLGYAYLADSPFILVILKRPEAIMASLETYRHRVTRSVIVTIIVIFLVVLWGATYLVRRIRTSEFARARAFREMQHTNKMATIGRLAAGVAHEINNPLAIINEKAGLIKDHLQMHRDHPVGEKTAELADSILRSVERCSAVTHRLLGFAKRMDVHQERIQMDVFIGEVLGFLGKESIYRNITVNRHFPDQPLVIESDRGQLQQVFLNVINNAFEAVEDGGRIDITLSETSGGEVAAVIEDDGCGIAQEDLERVFEPFFTTRKVGGTGLGLSITYGIVQRLGGRIEVDSVHGEGTRFTITMPRRHKPM
jgi:two-component system NtrC family sensor kinase